MVSPPIPLSYTPIRSAILQILFPTGAGYAPASFLVEKAIFCLIKRTLNRIIDKKNKLEVRGRDLVTGLPNTIEINEAETEEALHESIYKIVKAATNVLEQTPPELSADIVDKGIILTGGGSMLKGLNEVLKKELKVPVLIADSPLTCVVEGTGVLLDNIKLLEDN